jgi:rhodanese-related sulfurtransferase
MPFVAPFCAILVRQIIFALFWCNLRCAKHWQDVSPPATLAHPPFQLAEQDMTQCTELLALARQRGADKQLPYAGAVTPQEAYALLMANSHIKIVDVRTDAERDWIGTVHVPEAQHAEVQWSFYPSGLSNPDFMQQLEKVAGKDEVILFLCRSGVRSRHAAKLATENGYTQCFDVLEGFEGDKDVNGHRKSSGGWCKAGLPWLGA